MADLFGLKEREQALKCIEESYGIKKAAQGCSISTLDSRTDEEEADDSGKGLTLYRLGQVYQELGDHSKAFTLLFKGV